VIAPSRNEPDLVEFPDNLLKRMEFVFVSSVEDVLNEALEPAADVARLQPRRARGRASGYSLG
jgi:ATP-dependent Lon protease